MNKISRYYACAVIEQIEKEVDYTPSVMQMTSFLKMLITEPEDRQPAKVPPLERPVASEVMTGILQEVSRDTSISIQDILESKRRFRDLTDARHIARYLCRELTAHSYERIGAHLQCDHNSVIRSCEAVDDLIETNPKIRQKVESLRQNILSKFDGHPELKAPLLSVPSVPSCSK